MRVGSVIAIAALAGCAGNGAESIDERSGSLASLPTEVTLRYGEDRRVDEVLRLSFSDVLEDSRCAVDVTCVWAGNAKVQLGIAMGTGPTHPLELNSTLEPRAVDWNDIRVTLLAVTPEPVSTESIPLESYTVRLRLEAAR